MQDIINKQREEFEDITDWSYLYTLNRVKYASSSGNDFEENGEDLKEEIFDWHTSSIHQLLQALIEREELELDRNFTHEELRVWDTEWNKAKQDTINNLKTLQDSLK